jgi:soluble lytic murein transglycosylase-like protein
MHRVRARTADCLSARHLNLAPFPVTVRRRIRGMGAVLVVALLPSLITGVACRACAEPFVANQPQNEAAADPFADFVAEAAQRFGMPISWINAVMTLESGGDVRAVSPAGAMGLMQIMPNTWADLRSRYDLGGDPFDPRDNILAGAAYLREMHDRYGSPGFLAAYNAGPQRYDEYLATGRELPSETQLYVAILAPMIGETQVGGALAITRRAIPWQEAGLFAARDPRRSPAGSLSLLPSSDHASGGRSLAGEFALKPRAEGLFVGRANAGRSQ